MCSLDQVIEKSHILCMDDKFRDNVDPFCRYVEEYKLAEYNYEIGKSIKSTPAYWKTKSLYNLKVADRSLKSEITEIVCGLRGKQFISALNLVEDVPCKNLSDSCQRFRSELEFL